MSISNVVLFFRIIFHVVYCYLEAFVRLFKPVDRKSIAGEIVLVTGAGHGIGRQLAIGLSKLGTTVVVWDLNKENNEKTAEDINKAGGKAFAYVCDVADTAQIASVAAKVRADVGEVSILVNNAGILNGAYLMDSNEKMIRRLFEINTLSHFWMVREFLPDMMNKNHGHIMGVVSMAAFMGMATMTDYSSSKAAALLFGESLIAELAQQGYTGIRVTSLCPMIVDTGLLRNFENSLNPLLTPEEVSEQAIDGMLRNYELVAVPSYISYTTRFNNFLPRKAQSFLRTFGIVKVNPQYKKSD